MDFEVESPDELRSELVSIGQKLAERFSA
jgi:hypothetical protein